MQIQDTLIDYITGRRVPDIGPEGSRQLFEKILVEDKGFPKHDIRVDEPIKVTFQGAPYHSSLDLVVFVEDRAFMAIRCIAGSLGSYEREILAGARVMYEDYQIPFSVATNGKDALIRDVISGKPFGSGISAVPSRNNALELLKTVVYTPLAPEKKEREMILFRSYNMEKFVDECTGKLRLPL